MLSQQYKHIEYIYFETSFKFKLIKVMVRKYKNVSFWYLGVTRFCRLQTPTLRQQFSVESALIQAFFVVPMHERF